MKEKNKWSEAKSKFQELQNKVEQADPKILLLFPSINFLQENYLTKIKEGLKTNLRVLLVAAKEGYVNHYVLDNKYAVGGESRKRAISRLFKIELLKLSEEKSEKNVTKHKYHLTGKGVILCTAFPLVFESEKFISLIKNHYVSKSLANILSVLYLKQDNEGSNRLIETLHYLADSGLNIENISEDALSKRLLEAEEEVFSEPKEELLFEMLEQSIDWIHSAKDKEVKELFQNMSTIANLIRTNSVLAKNISAVLKDIFFFLKTSDFQVWLRNSKDFNSLKEIALQTAWTHIGDYEGENLIQGFWEKRKQILEDIRITMREECISNIKE